MKQEKPITLPVMMKTGNWEMCSVIDTFPGGVVVQHQFRQFKAIVKSGSYYEI